MKREIFETFRTRGTFFSFQRKDQRRQMTFSGKTKRLFSVITSKGRGKGVGKRGESSLYNLIKAAELACVKCGRCDWLYEG